MSRRYIHTGYSDTLESVKEDYSSLVQFWRRCDLWASERDTKLTLIQAFDGSESIKISSEFPKYKNTGWWKISATGNESEIIFEEKRLAAKKKLDAIHDEPLTNSNLGFTITITVVVSLLGSVFIGSVVFFMRYMKTALKSEPETYRLSFIENLKLNIIVLQTSDFSRALSQLISTGYYGTVYKCFMSQFLADVAVKTISDMHFTDAKDNQQASKCLFSEIQVMSQVGQHENILRLLGACLEEEIFLVTEYCQHGSLLTFLRTQSSKGSTVSRYELIEFCIQIASGMNYLQQKNVIHGDLSARNVLLDENKVCKISDFGLSRKLGHYEKYMKKGDEPLPWRWMAIESLTNMEFSFKTDVWSMGVTFWEIFSLGKLPFPEFSWDTDTTFCDKLKDGLRLGMPEFANDDIYKIIASCWEIESSSSPSALDVFNQLNAQKGSQYAVLV